MDITLVNRIAIISLLIFLLSDYYTDHHIARAQQADIHDPYVNYERVLHVHGILPPHSATAQPLKQSHLAPMDTLLAHPWQQVYHPSSQITGSEHWEVGAYDPEVRTAWRNLRPGGMNNGAVWEGRGFTTSMTAGVYARYRFLSAAFRPQVIHTQNRDFSLSRYEPRGERSEFAYPFYNMDRPQRFGEEPFWRFYPGQSFIKADYMGFEAGWANQNRWWGPAMHYPIIMSNNAPGFHHYFLGTSKPQDIYIGELETTLLWGRLQESDYFDELAYNDERYITGLNISINPSPVPNLTLGFNRVYYRVLPPEGVPVSDLFKVFEVLTKSSRATGDNPSGGDNFTQMLSLYGRWVFPDSGFEVYGEWARNDHAWNMRDALGEPEHARSYMAGFQKTFRLPDENLLAINAEIVNLENTNPRRLRSQGSIYQHSTNRQGYTHHGQLMGAATGPGSNSQILTGNYFFGNGKVSGWIRRTVYDNDVLFRSDVMMEEPENENVAKYWLHNFEVGGGSSLTWFHSAWEAELSLEYMREFNQDFLYKNDRNHITMHVRLRYRLSSLR